MAKKDKKHKMKGGKKLPMHKGHNKKDPKHKKNVKVKGKKELKESVSSFVTAIMDKNYKAANDALNVMIGEKIKQQIINNNVKIF